MRFIKGLKNIYSNQPKANVHRFQKQLSSTAILILILYMKRIFDCSFSLVGVILLLPLMFIIYITIRRTMPDGPAIFKQSRVGKGGKIFTLYKFRTMYLDKSKTSISVMERNHISSVGVFLRKYKLDELPELFNVLIGDMSIVGPRPDVPGYADKLEGENRNILELRPGITGPASLIYANEEKMLASVDNPQQYNDEVIYPSKVKINLQYYYNQNLWNDLKIIFRTIFRKY